jgi:hypothetical protein
VTGQSRYEQGLQIRREVLGADCVDAAMDGADEFMAAAQHAAATDQRAVTYRAPTAISRRMTTCP